MQYKRVHVCGLLQLDVHSFLLSIKFVFHNYTLYRAANKLGLMCDSSHMGLRLIGSTLDKHFSTLSIFTLENGMTLYIISMLVDICKHCW